MPRGQDREERGEGVTFWEKEVVLELKKQRKNIREKGEEGFGEKSLRGGI